MITLLLLIGTIDRIDEGVIVAEVVDGYDNVSYIEFNTREFPCQPREQQRFYLTYEKAGLVWRCLDSANSSS